MNRLDRLLWILLAVIGLLLLMDAYLIVTPYRYFHLAAPHGLVRVNRFTGEAEKLWGTGWKPMAPVQSRFVLEEEQPAETPRFRPLRPDEEVLPLDEPPPPARAEVRNETRRAGNFMRRRTLGMSGSLYPVPFFVDPSPLDLRSGLLRMLQISSMLIVGTAGRLGRLTVAC